MGLIFNAAAYAGVAVNHTTTPATTCPIALHTAWPGRAGSQSTSEATFTNYARTTTPRTAAGYTVNGTTGVVTLTSNVSFPASSASGNNQYLPFFSIGDGAGGIHAMGAIVKSGTTQKAFTAATSDTITCVGHGGAVGDRVAFFAQGGNALPTGITEGTVYYIISAGTSDTLTISATSGGTVIDITAAGSGTMVVLDGFQVGNSTTCTLTTSSSIILD
jgi:hypothetical protein